MSTEVPQWLLDNLNAVDAKVTKIGELLGTTTNLISDLRVKEASQHARLETIGRHEEILSDLKKTETTILAELASLKAHLAQYESTLKELKDIKAALDTYKMEGAQLNTKFTVYVSIISFVVAAIGSVAVALITKSLGA